MAQEPHVIPHIKEIMSFRMKMKADPKFASAVRAAIGSVCEAHGAALPAKALESVIIVHPDEVATPESVGSLPVGSQCQAF